MPLSAVVVDNCSLGHFIKRYYIIGCNSIPQGTILDPLLFLIYVSDLPQHCDTTAVSYLFADGEKTFNAVWSAIPSTADHTSHQLISYI